MKSSQRKQKSPGCLNAKAKKTRGFLCACTLKLTGAGFRPPFSGFLLPKIYNGGLILVFQWHHPKHPSQARFCWSIISWPAFGLWWESWRKMAGCKPTCQKLQWLIATPPACTGCSANLDLGAPTLNPRTP